MFETLQTAPTDPILGLTSAFREDTNPDKINLGVGEYRDSDGKTPVFAAVEAAEKRLVDQKLPKTYLPIDGTPEHGVAVRELLFGATSDLAAVTAQAPGGTGALRLAADFFHALFPKARLCLSEPTWANHPKVFQAAGMEVVTYPYFDAATDGLDFEAMTAALETLTPGDIVLLHGCCHNPTGVDPSIEQWKRIGDILADRHLIPFVDFAYQGLGDGLLEDAGGLRELCRPGVELFVASSFSKNFGLYRERIGALTAVASTPEAAQVVLSHLKIAARTSFSNPPAHGSAIVTEILGDSELRKTWEEEVALMRNRINGMRRLLVQSLADRGVEKDLSFIERQRGMFSFSGLNPQQVEILRDKHSIYIVGSGRINVAGITPHNLDYLCDALASIL